MGEEPEVLSPPAMEGLESGVFARSLVTHFLFLCVLFMKVFNEDPI